MKVCCFKSGFCGTIKGFRGDAKIDSPSFGGTSCKKGVRKPGNVSPWRPRRPQLALIHISTLPWHSLIIELHDCFIH
jgi:hypothetical protein